MSHNRHSWVPFYPSDWIAGTARMNRMQKAVYFDICCYNWDKAEAVPESELTLMFGDIDGWQEILDQLIAANKLDRTPNGIANGRAIAEAKASYETWTKKVEGGRAGAKKRWSAKRKPKKTNDKSDDRTPNGMGIGVPIDNHNHNHNHNHIDRGAPDGAAKSEKGTRWKSGQQVPDEWRQWAIDQRYKPRDVREQADSFSDYWAGKPGKDGVKLDWEATWRNWMRKAEQYSGVEKFPEPKKSRGEELREQGLI